MPTNLFINNLQTDPAYFFAVLITVVVSITLHELAHGYAAIRLGDDTPIYTGHMTLNPLVHMGGFSLFLLAIAGIAFGAMPVDRTRLRGKYGEAIMAAAGPATNLLLAVLALTGLALWERFDHRFYDLWTPAVANAKYLLFIFGVTNVMLAIFNMLPVPPLDGGWIMANLVPAYRNFLQGEFARGALAAVFIAMFLGGGRYIGMASYESSMKLLTTVSGRDENHFDVIRFRIAVTHADEFRELRERMGN